MSSKATNADVSWTNMPAAACTGVETWDTSGTPQRLQWAAFSSSVTTASGDTLTIPSTQQTAGLTGMDVNMSKAVLDALYPNSGTTTIGTKTITGATKTRLMTANGSDSAAGTELSTSGGYTAGGTATTYSAAA